ncbi:MAG: hypothetical protein M3124_02075 [Actinomycetota bacterium]|nr:hypothetical protein [Actinomycetota bacterium]
MPLDRALRTALRNLSTFFLIVALVTVPLNVVWGFLYQDVTALREVHDDIADLPKGQRVRGVGSSRLDRARYAELVVLAVEAALIPALLRVTRRAIDIDESGHVPTALGAWRGLGHRSEPPGSGWNGGVVVMTVLFAATIWLLASSIGKLIVAPLGDQVAWLGVGLTRGLALALALPFALVGLIEARAPTSPD